jgi:hypothetical protein
VNSEIYISSCGKYFVLSPPVVAMASSSGSSYGHYLGLVNYLKFANLLKKLDNF